MKAKAIAEGKYTDLDKLQSPGKPKPKPKASSLRREQHKVECIDCGSRFATNYQQVKRCHTCVARKQPKNPRIDERLQPPAGRLLEDGSLDADARALVDQFLKSLLAGDIAPLEALLEHGAKAEESREWGTICERFDRRVARAVQPDGFEAGWLSGASRPAWS